METKINDEYQRIIDKINQVSEECRNTGNVWAVTLLQEAAISIRNLGTRPVLSDSVEQFISITNNMTKTYAAKNHDYGNSFDDSLDKFGLIASIVRMGDKMNRLESLTKKEAKVKDESIKDTLLDLANYAIMTVMWMNKQNEK